MQPRLLRINAATVFAPALAFLVACSHVVSGRPTYGPETASATLPLVKTSELMSLIPPPSDVGSVMKTKLNVSDIYAVVGAVPTGTVSDPKCAGALIAGAEPMYRGSGFRAINGLGLRGPENRLVDEAAAAFGDADEAHEFVETRTAQWKECVNRTLTLSPADGPQSNWIASGPNTSYGVRVVLRRQEGGQGYGCSHAMAPRSNIVADVLACNYDDSLVNDQAAKIVNMILAKIPTK